MSRYILCIAALLVSYSTHAITVTVNSTDRTIRASASFDPEFSSFTEETLTTGDWNESVSAWVSIGGSSASQTSSIGASGSYSIYEISYTGGASVNDAVNSSASSSFHAEITFAEDVFFTVSASCSSSSFVSGTIFGEGVLCGSGTFGNVTRSGTLEAGVYQLTAATQLFSSGSSSSTISSGSSFSASFSVVPIPAAAWLFGSAFAALFFARRKSIVTEPVGGSDHYASNSSLQFDKL